MRNILIISAAFLTGLAGFFLMAAAVGLVFSLPVMWLWNACLVPAVSSIQPIGWVQTWGLVVLFGLLFKSGNSSKE